MRKSLCNEFVCRDTFHTFGLKNAYEGRRIKARIKKRKEQSSSSFVICRIFFLYASPRSSPSFKSSTSFSSSFMHFRGHPERLPLQCSFICSRQPASCNFSFSIAKSLSFSPVSTNFCKMMLLVCWSLFLCSAWAAVAASCEVLVL